MSKIRKIYNLRKTNNLRQQSPAQEESRLSEAKQELEHSLKVSDVFEKNASVLSQNLKDQAPSKIAE